MGRINDRLRRSPDKTRQDDMRGWIRSRFLIRKYVTITQSAVKYIEKKLGVTSFLELLERMTKAITAKQTPAQRVFEIRPIFLRLIAAAKIRSEDRNANLAPVMTPVFITVVENRMLILNRKFDE